MSNMTEVAVTLTPELFRQLSLEASTLGVPLEWLVASLVVDTFEDEGAPLLTTV